MDSHPDEIAACPQLPAPFRRIGRVLPLRLMRRIAEPLLNSVFADAIADGMLDILNSRELVLRIEDLGVKYGFRLENSRLRIGEPTTAEASISGPLAAFLWLASREADADTLFFHRHLSMSGDTELGLVVKNVVDAVNISTLPGGLMRGLSLLSRLIPAQAPGCPDMRMPGSPYQ